MCNFCSFFSYVGGVLVTNPFSPLLIDIFSDYPANYNTRGTLKIIFLICSDLLNCLRSVGTTVSKKVKSLSFTISLKKPPFLRCFGVCFVQPSQIFQVQTKISTIRPVFPYSLSVSYDYGYINYFNYYNKSGFWICWLVCHIKIINRLEITTNF